MFTNVIDIHEDQYLTLSFPEPRIEEGQRLFRNLQSYKYRVMSPWLFNVPGLKRLSVPGLCDETIIFPLVLFVKECKYVTVMTCSLHGCTGFLFSNKTTAKPPELRQNDFKDCNFRTRSKTKNDR